MGANRYSPEEYKQIIQRLKSIGHLDRDFSEDYPHTAPVRRYKEIPFAASSSHLHYTQIRQYDGGDWLR